MKRHVIKYTHRDGVKLVRPETWCGAELKVFEFAFDDAQHVALALEQNTNIEPCRKCCAAIVKALEGGK